MSEDVQAQVLRDVLTTAATAVFQSDQTAEAPSTTTLDFVSVIGFTGTHLRGALVVGSSRELATSLIGESLARTPDDGDIADWVGEMSNLTLGRVKMLLSLRGVDLQLSTPVLLQGLGLTWESDIDACHAVSLHDGAVQVRAWFDVRADPVWTEPPLEAQGDQFDCGDFLLF